MVTSYDFQPRSAKDPLSNKFPEASDRLSVRRWLLALTGDRLDGPARVTLEAAVPAAACEGEAWAEIAWAWTQEAVRAALRSVA